MPNPKIIGGICEYCGIEAIRCQHYKDYISADLERLDQATMLAKSVVPPGADIFPPLSPLAPMMLDEKDFAKTPEQIARAMGRSNEIVGDKVAPKFVAKNPLNTPKSEKLILIGCVDFSNLTGMPIYIYNLGRGLIAKGYQVAVVSTIGGDITDLAKEAGISVYDWQDINWHNLSPIVLILNEPISERLLKIYPDIPAYNIIHSARKEDEPIVGYPQIRKYLVPKVGDYEYCLTRGIPKDKIDYLHIPIDFERFSPTKNKPAEENKYKILCPATFDKLRLPMFKSLIKRAEDDPKISVVIKGHDYGALDGIKLPSNVKLITEASFNIENYVAFADEVASIFEGTTALEAWAMNKKVSIYDENGNYEIKEKPKDFQKYDLKNVANKFIKIINEKWADIIIPHHDKPQLLAQALKTIPLRNYNVIVVRGSYFSKSCNRGAKLAETENIIFANDDIVFNSQALWNLVDSKKDLAGIKQFYPDGKELCLGIFINEFGNYELTTDEKKVLYPSGAIFKIKKPVWEKLKGFNEGFINGGEDQDLFLRVAENDYSLGFVDGSVIHYCSQSTGRFDYLKENDDLLHDIWKDEKLKNVIIKLNEQDLFSDRGDLLGKNNNRNKVVRDVENPF